MHSTQRTGPVTWRMRQSRESGPRVMRRASTLAAMGTMGSLKTMDSRSLARGACLGRAALGGAVEGSTDLEHDGALSRRPLLQRSAAKLDGGGGPLRSRFDSGE